MTQNEHDCDDEPLFQPFLALHGFLTIGCLITAIAALTCITLLHPFNLTLPPVFICSLVATLSIAALLILDTIQRTPRETNIPGNKPASGTFTSARILLAEDNRINQHVAVKLLEKFGCAVDTADNGEEAVQAIQSGTHYDLVLMDCLMPIADGYEATGLIREWQFKNRVPRTPIIAFTANTLEGDIQLCRDAGMDDYITKPMRDDDLQRILLDWLPKEKCVLETTSKATLDESVFNRFSEIVGTEAVPLLASHREASRNYFHIIKTSLDNRDFPELSKSAHTIKSMNANLGALKTVHLARQLEILAQSESPDITLLRNLTEQLELEAGRADAAISQCMASSA